LDFSDPLTPLSKAIETNFILMFHHNNFILSL
jgi:hypothetical protein